MSKMQIFYNDSGGDFAASYREDILSRIRNLESTVSNGSFEESEPILFYIVILTTLIRHVPFDECVNEFVVLAHDLDYIRSLKEKFMPTLERRLKNSIEAPEAYIQEYCKLAAKAFDDLIEASENPPEY